MLETYKAKLRGNHIIWQDEVPELLSGSEPVDVMVTVLRESEATELRPIGLAKGEFIVPDNFDEPLPDEVLAEFEN